MVDSYRSMSNIVLFIYLFLLEDKRFIQPNQQTLIQPTKTQQKNPKKKEHKNKQTKQKKQKIQGERSRRSSAGVVTPAADDGSLDLESPDLAPPCPKIGFRPPIGGGEKLVHCGGLPETMGQVKEETRGGEE